jgi:pimeloyl-ACP methyl ester carboxylesterase
LRQLAVRLSQSGHHVLRFDYYGTGDSLGAERDGDVASWRDDIETAVTELKDMTGVAKVSLVGLRLGANLAAEVSARHPDDIDSLVLWEPLPAGKILGDNCQDQGDVPSIDSSLLSSALPSRTLVMLTTHNPQAYHFEDVSVERLDFLVPWIEERIVSGTIPRDALQHIVNWLK